MVDFSRIIRIQATCAYFLTISRYIVRISHIITFLMSLDFNYSPIYIYMKIVIKTIGMTYMLSAASSRCIAPTASKTALLTNISVLHETIY